MKEKQKTEKKTGMLIALALVAVVAVVGGTYAWLTLTRQGSNVNVIKTGTLELSYEKESAGISLTGDDAQPITDEDGINLTGYNFSLNNTGNLSANYTIYLDDATELDGAAITNRMPDKYIRYALNYQTSSVTKLLTEAGTHPNRILESGTLAAGETKNFNLKLWIDSTADNGVMGTTFAGKIRVEAIQAKSGQEVVPAPTTAE